ncbi:MAG: ROK family protein [Planctomycetales bacterium]|nr:ROK family protein [Planctomycetales bacterium]
MSGPRLGIEIGGTKLQLGIGAGDGTLLDLRRAPIDARRGAGEIRRAIAELGGLLVGEYAPESVGVGFGGPVLNGRTIVSHQVEGWQDFPLQQWLEEQWSLPVRLANDCDAAALAEATYGAGRDARIVFYVTVGTGVGGGLVINGAPHGEGRPAVAEIGHLRPGLQARRPEQTVESVASGWGIAAEAAARVRGDLKWPVHQLGAKPSREGNEQQRQRELEASDDLSAEYAADLLARCDGDLDRLTAVDVAVAASDGNELANEALQHAIETLGWAIAQVITLTAAEKVVVGGGVSLLGEARFFVPLRAACRQYVFPPLADAYEILPAALGEEVVVHGAIALANTNR